MANNRTQVTSVSENYLPHLKFAKQHKLPSIASSLTFWEEDIIIPSRLDLGKSRYGGPDCSVQSKLKM